MHMESSQRQAQETLLSKGDICLLFIYSFLPITWTPETPVRSRDLGSPITMHSPLSRSSWAMGPALGPALLALPQASVAAELHSASSPQPFAPVAAWPSAAPSLLLLASSSPQPWTQILPSARGHHWKLQTQMRKIKGVLDCEWREETEL